VACATCHDLFVRHARGVRVQPLWEVLLETETLPERAHLQDADSPALVLHDPCTSRHYERLRDSVRSLADRLGIRHTEPRFSGDTTPCCGYGGLMSAANPELADEVAHRRCEESGGTLLTWCAMCRDSFARTGEPVLYLLDFLFPGKGDAATRPAPGFTLRQENRARFRERLLKRYWEEEVTEQPSFTQIQLHLDSETEALLDRRRILKDDVRKVIRYAEKTGRRLYDEEKQHFLAYHKPVRVTYWVAYAPEGSGYRVFTAYSHRMTIPGDTA